MPQWSMPPDGVITFFEVKWGDFLNQFLFHYISVSAGTGVISLGGWVTPREHDARQLRAGELIVGFTVWHGQYVDSIAVITSVKTYGPYGGGKSPTVDSLLVPDGASFIGLHGRAGNWVDALGIVCGVAIPDPRL